MRGGTDPDHHSHVLWIKMKMRFHSYGVARRAERSDECVSVLKIKFGVLFWVGPAHDFERLPSGLFASPFQQRGAVSPQCFGSSNSSMTNLRHWVRSHFGLSHFGSSAPSANSCESFRARRGAW